MAWIKHSVEKSFAKGASAIVQRWKVGGEHRLIVGKGRVDNLESSFLDLLYLVTKVQGRLLCHTSHVYSRIQ